MSDGLSGEDLGAGGIDRGLGRAVQIPQGHAAGDQRGGEIGVQRFAAAQAEQGAVRHGQIGAPAGFEQHAPAAGGSLEDGGAARFEACGERDAVTGGLRGDEFERHAAHERQTEFEQGDVEHGCRFAEPEIVIAQAGLQIDTGEEAVERAVGDADAFGPAGGA
ncbi:hypothetical protein R69658_02669 [Paraburkholderia aspalathi]|uniref:Uncharacterized protein n=1 Tax=Paraburkholderia aspalathi TaxID=1324617 RepID=A0ABM8RFB0_9BURK|nr:hypothetical protein R69658_02669 [Paraburkholderia aspalathi]